MSDTNIYKYRDFENKEQAVCVGDVLDVVGTNCGSCQLIMRDGRRLNNIARKDVVEKCIEDIRADLADKQAVDVKKAQDAYYKAQKVGYVYPCPTGMEAALLSQSTPEPTDEKRVIELMIKSFKEVLRISDRNHESWNESKRLIAEYERIREYE